MCVQVGKAIHMRQLTHFPPIGSQHHLVALSEHVSMRRSPARCVLCLTKFYRIPTPCRSH